MMINKRLINEVSDSKRYIALNVIIQWIGLVSNITIIFTIAIFLQNLYQSTIDAQTFFTVTFVIILAISIRFWATIWSTKMSFNSSKTVKIVIREKIYKKLLQMGATYKAKLSTAEIVQLSVEGVDQLETYFGAYLPQFFYSMLAPLTLFAVLCFVDVFAGVVLLLSVPLIPVTIAAVQTFARKLLDKYWGQYTTLGDTFLENLQGLTTLKIYQADGYKNEKMNEESEKFRKITMKVLTMQLNSVTIMDIIAFGGAAVGIIIAVTQFSSGRISLAGCIAIILLSADFFIPMRLLGSYFHIAMNGMAASDKIFKFLDTADIDTARNSDVQKGDAISLQKVSFSYQKEREILSGIDMDFNSRGFTAVVGESGSGKSTIAGILTGQNKGYFGTVKVGDCELSTIADKSLFKNITYVGFDSYLFKGTIKENLLMANPIAEDKTMWNVLDKVNLSDFLKGEKGLDTPLMEKAANLSGGQRQRLALARAILHDTPVYIFDEATSNIDVESENEILEQIYQLAKTKTVIFITHRLANVSRADNIYVIKSGRVFETGGHDKLLLQNGAYKNLWQAQYELENYKKEAI